MRWLLGYCILLATTVHVLSGHRPKRDLSYIKNLIASKLFGTETIFVQLPEIPKNESHQLFKIEGHDDFIIKVTQKSEKKKEKKIEAVKEILRDPVIVSPDIAIIGSYLGTSTQGETLLAIDFVKKLVKSGTLSSERDKLIQEVGPISPQVPHNKYFTQEPLKPVNVFTEKKGPIDLFPAVNERVERIKYFNPNSVSSVEYRPLIVASEVKYKPVQNKYSYKQKGETGDMTFQSYNNQDVLVTRTVKKPQLPDHIKLRFAEVASFVANPYLIGSHQPVALIPEEHLVQPMSFDPGSFGFLNPSEGVKENMIPAPIPSYVMNRFSMAQPTPGFSVVEEPGYVVANNIDSYPIWIDSNPGIFSEPLGVPDYSISSTMPFDIREHLTEAELNKMNHFINGKLHHRKTTVKGNDGTLKTPSIKAKVSENVKKTSQKEAEMVEGYKTNVTSENSDLNDEIVTQYFYKQMNHNSRDNYTVVKVGDSPILKHSEPPTKTDVVKSNDEIPDGFIFMPPENIDIPPPNVIAKTSDVHNQNKNGDKNSTQSENYPKRFHANKYEDKEVQVFNENIGSLTNTEHSLANDPIVVLEDKDLKYNLVSNKESTTSSKPFTGGPVF